jgi:hypothetical protein
MVEEKPRQRCLLSDRWRVESYLLLCFLHACRPVLGDKNGQFLHLEGCGTTSVLTTCRQSAFFMSPTHGIADSLDVLRLQVERSWPIRRPEFWSFYIYRRLRWHVEIDMSTVRPTAFCKSTDVVDMSPKLATCISRHINSVKTKLETPNINRKLYRNWTISRVCKLQHSQRMLVSKRISFQKRQSVELPLAWGIPQLTRQEWQRLKYHNQGLRNHDITRAWPTNGHRSLQHPFR